MTSECEDGGEGYYCETCQQFLSSKKNKKRHEKAHRLCTVCLRVTSRNSNHCCNPSAVTNLVQWLTLVDGQNKPFAYVLGLTPETVAKYNQRDAECQEFQSIVEATLAKSDG